MKGKVKWPDTVIHTSVFTKLKRVIKESGMAISSKEVMTRYSQISAKRNELFHGGSSEISLTDVEKAFGAYKWLKEKSG